MTWIKSHNFTSSLIYGGKIPSRQNTRQAHLRVRLETYLCNLLVDRRLLYLKWKLSMSPINWCMGLILLQGFIQKQTKMFRVSADPSWIPKYDRKIPISWTIVLIFISAGSLECLLSDEVWKHTQLKETAKWQAERRRHLLFSPHSSIVLLSEVQLGSANNPTTLFILVCHSVTPWSRSG